MSVYTLIEALKFKNIQAAKDNSDKAEAEKRWIDRKAEKRNTAGLDES